MERNIRKLLELINADNELREEYLSKGNDFFQEVMARCDKSPETLGARSQVRTPTEGLVTAPERQVLFREEDRIMSQTVGETPTNPELSRGMMFSPLQGDTDRHSDIQGKEEEEEGDEPNPYMHLTELEVASLLLDLGHRHQITTDPPIASATGFVPRSIWQSPPSRVSPQLAAPTEARATI